MANAHAVDLPGALQRLGQQQGPAYHRIKLHGGRGSLLWGYHTAATLRSWRIWKGPQGWQLSAAADRVDAFQSRQTPLLFTAPRERGLWMWPVETIAIQGLTIRASLGEPEQ